MKNFKAYCDQTLNSITLSDDTKNRILSNCMSHNSSNYSLKHNFFYVRKKLCFIITFMVIFISLSIFYTNHQTKIKLTNGITTITFNNGVIYFDDTIANNISTEDKLVEPEGTVENWSYNQVLTYLGSNFNLPYIPKKLTSHNANAEYPIYINSNGQVTFDNITFIYQEKSNINDGAYIDITVSKGKLPLTDESYTGNNNSHIGNTRIKIVKITPTMYRSEFIYNDIGYIVSSNLIDKEEFVNVLRSIIK